MNIINKCIKSYLCGKKNLEIDNDKAYLYFSQCINLIDNINKNNKIDDNNILNLIKETEVECNKYLELTLESTLTKSIVTYDNNINLFKLIEIGDTHKLNKYKYGQINFNIYNDDGISPLHYAIDYGDILFLKLAFKLGCNIDHTTLLGYTLLEYACLEKDPNIINFLVKYGANMKKHIDFRENKKYINRGNEIDIILLQKIILDHDSFIDISKYEFKYLNWIFKYIDKNSILNIKYSDSNTDILFFNLIFKLDNLINNFSLESRNTYINIIKEELEYELLNKLYCPNNKIDIILYNLVPFINYNYNLNLFWLIKLEIKFLILKNRNINLKKKLIEKYIDTNILTYDFLNFLIKL
jgi:ankyrin repeat protein